MKNITKFNPLEKQQTLQRPKSIRELNIAIKECPLLNIRIFDEKLDVHTVIKSCNAIEWYYLALEGFVQFLDDLPQRILKEHQKKLLIFCYPELKNYKNWCQKPAYSYDWTKNTLGRS